MGCTSSTTANPGPAALAAARGDPEPRDVALPDGSTLRVGLATDSLAYCLLAAHGDGALFIDVRSREAFNRSHIHGAWWLEHLAQEPPYTPKSPAAAPLQTKQAVASNASRSTAASSSAPPARPVAGDSEEAAAAWETAVRQRCSLRTVVVYGAEGGALKDPAVLGALGQLARLAVRPKGQLLVLRGGLAAFTRRFAFCVRKQGGERSQPLPPGPAEILPPGCSAARGPPALYLGTERCVREPGAEKVLAALGVKVVVNLSGQPCAPRKKVGKVIEVRPAPGGGESMVVTAREACDKVRRQGGPCFLYGPAAALAAALLAAEALPSTVRTGDEADAWVRLRFPATPVLDNAARGALTAATAKNRPGGAQDALAPLVPASPPSPRQLAPTAGTGTGVAAAGGDAAGTRSAGQGGGQGAADAGPAPPGTSYVEELCAKLRKQRGGEAALGTVRAALTHVLEHPTEPKYRRLRGSNKRVKREILSHKEAVLLLRLSGFVADGEDLELPPAAPLQALRDLLARLPPAKGR